jgi:hypothetical protein
VVELVQRLLRPRDGQWKPTRGSRGDLNGPARGEELLSLGEHLTASDALAEVEAALKRLKERARPAGATNDQPEK